MPDCLEGLCFFQGRCYHCGLNSSLTSLLLADGYEYSKHKSGRRETEALPVITTENGRSRPQADSLCSV